MSLILDGSNGTTGNLANGDLQVNGVTVGKGAGTQSANTAVGISALNANTTGNYNVAVGYQALTANTSAQVNTAVGYQAAYTNTTGTENTAIGESALKLNSTGSYNTAVGGSALVYNTASNNTAVGYQAMYSNTTATTSTAVGYQAGYTNSTGGTYGGYNTYFGTYAGNLDIGGRNTYIGGGAGNAMTTGNSNTILGRYSGNQGGLDIRTASNYIVLSDGDGNPTAYWSNVGTFNFTANAGDVAGNLFNANAGPYGLRIKFTAASPNSAGNYFQECRDGGNTLRYQLYSNGGIANFSANNSNLSDAREKKDIELAGNYLDKICAIPVKTFLYNDQTDTDKNLGVIAQDVEAVAPELVMESNWGTDEEPKMRLSIYQTDLQYALMKAIQELKAKVDAQAAEIEALKAKGV